MSANLLSRAKVLIIDDEASNVRLLERILEMFGGARARSTTDSREALRLFSEFAPDLILLDLHMPHLDGFAVIEQIKAAIPPVEYLPILVLTADVTLATKRRALTLGAKDILTKPLDHFEVVLRMNNLLENRFLHAELQRQNLFLARQEGDRIANSVSRGEPLVSIREDVVKEQRLHVPKDAADDVPREIHSAGTMALGNGELLLPYLQAHAPARELGYLHNILAAAQDVIRIADRLGEFSQLSPHAHPVADALPAEGERRRVMRMLVVDSQEIIGNLIADYLKSDGVEAVASRNSRVALDLFQREAFDLVIIDQSQPDLNGQELAHRIKEVSPQTPIILLSNRDGKPSFGSAHLDRIVMLSKPLSPASLRRAIQDATSGGAAVAVDVSGG